MSIEVKIQNNSEEITKDFENAIERALMAIGETAVTHAKDLLTAQKAVDTGRLRNSVAYASKMHPANTIKFSEADQKAGKKGESSLVNTSEENVVYVGTAVHYGTKIEFGTSKMRARPYIAPAVSQHSDEYRNIIKQSLENA
jgi:HK97 gp10 family phage protein